MSVLFITTSDAQSSRKDLLLRLITSIDAFARANPDAGIKLLLLVQRAQDRPCDKYPPFVDPILSYSRMSLSAARNFMIAKAFDGKSFDENTIVMFPDDDCWYPPETLQLIYDSFSTHQTLDFWFARYRSEPDSLDRGCYELASVSDVIKRASSNTIAIRGHLLVGLWFDETLGVGTLNPGGEDTAFAIAAFARAREVTYLNVACIGHRDPDPEFTAKYYRGSLIAIARNRRVPGVRIQFLRKLFVGLYFVLRGRLQFSQYASDVQTGIRAYVAA